MGKILIVDDDIEFGEWIETGLKAAGEEVDVVTTAKDALAKVETDKYEVLIVDIALPDLDGYKLISEVKCTHPYIAVIGISGIVKMDDLIVKSYQAGADDVLSKPFSFELLVTKINKLREKANKKLY